MPSNGLDTIRGDVTVELGGRTRRLVYDWNAIAALEEAGRPMLDGTGWRISDARSLRLLLWAGLLRDDPSLTVEDVGRMIPMRGAQRAAIVAAYEEALRRSIAADDDGEEVADDSDEDPPTGRAPAGPTSGRSAASDSDSPKTSSGD